MTKEEADEAAKEKKQESTQIVNMDKKSTKKISLDDFELLCVIGRGSFGKVCFFTLDSHYNKKIQHFLST